MWTQLMWLTTGATVSYKHGKEPPDFIRSVLHTSLEHDSEQNAVQWQQSATPFEVEPPVVSA